MSVVVSCNNGEKTVNVSRLNKRLPEEILFVHKRIKMMNTSTPKNMGGYRDAELIPNESSPIDEFFRRTRLRRVLLEKRWIFLETQQIYQG